MMETTLQVWKRWLIRNLRINGLIYLFKSFGRFKKFISFSATTATAAAARANNNSFGVNKMSNIMNDSRYEGCGEEGPLRSIFFAEFHPTAGPIIRCQVCEKYPLLLPKQKIHPPLKKAFKCDAFQLRFRLNIRRSKHIVVCCSRSEYIYVMIKYMLLLFLFVFWRKLSHSFPSSRL